MNATVVGAIRLTDSGNTVQPMPAETSVSIAAASTPRIDALGIKTCIVETVNQLVMPGRCLIPEEPYEV